MAPSATQEPITIDQKSTKQSPRIVRFDANDPATTCEALVEVLNRDGGVIVDNFLTPQLAAQIRRDLKPYFDTDHVDTTGIFPQTTQRAASLVKISPACVEYLTTPLLLDVANAFLSDTYSYWMGNERRTVTSKAQISSTSGFRIQPGGPAQPLHRDDSDYHAREVDMPVVFSCVAAVTRSTAENGATVVIPGSHKWDLERMPTEAEAVPAELDVGGALFFLGNTYHGGGRNYTTDSVRETVGMFFTKAHYRQAENQYLAVPVESAKQLSPQVQRLLGYGVAPPGMGFLGYQDPMMTLFGVKDKDTAYL
ncbi:hypothetical protein ABEF95_014657 [Exophiala dermatitidis]